MAEDTVEFFTGSQCEYNTSITIHIFDLNMLLTCLSQKCELGPTCTCTYNEI